MNIVKLFSVSQGMSAIQRYSQLHLLKSESVMEHTGFVCLFTYTLCEEINSVSSPNDKLDVGMALQKAIVHDIDEVITGDIPRPTKYYSEESVAVFKKIAEAGIDQIINELRINSRNMKTNWEQSKAGKEGMIVALADLSSVIYKLWEEILMLGNKKLFRQANEVKNFLGDFQAKIADGNWFDPAQKHIIDIALDQLYTILNEISKASEPIHGTFKTFEVDTMVHHR